MRERESRIEVLAGRAFDRLVREVSGDRVRMAAEQCDGRAGTPPDWGLSGGAPRALADGERIRRGDGTLWIRLRGTIPAAWKGARVTALVDTGGLAGIAWRGTDVLGATDSADGHLFAADAARGGELIELMVEVSAGGAGVAPATFGGAVLARWNADAALSATDLDIALGLLRTLPSGSARRAQVLFALGEAVGVENGSGETIRECLREVLTRRNGDTIHRVSTAIISPRPRTRGDGRRGWMGDAARIGAAMASAPERVPGLVAVGPDAMVYAAIRKSNPPLYQAIRRAIRKGQWEVVGGFWSTPISWDIGGESIVRQLLVGRQFLQGEFGVEPHEVVLPEIQGACPALPQILKAAGYQHLVACDPASPTGRDSFQWEAPDGSRIIVHRAPGGIASEVSAEVFARSAGMFAERDRGLRSLALVAATARGTATLLPGLLPAIRDVEGLPSVRPERLSEFFAKALRDIREMPLWVGAIPRLTPTIWCARRRAANRRGETLLAFAEFLDASAAVMEAVPGRALPPVAHHADHDLAPALPEPTSRDHLDRAWRLLLANQGDAGIGSQEAASDFVILHELGTAVIRHSLERIASVIDGATRRQPVLLINPLGHERAEVVPMPGGGLAYAKVPPCGIAVLDAAESRPIETDAQPVRAELVKRRAVMENGFVRAEFETDGRLVSLRDLQADREVLPDGEFGNRFEVEDCPLAPTTVKVEFQERTAARSVLRIETVSGDSKIATRVVMRAGMPRLDFETAIGWKRPGGLAVVFPIDILSNSATYQTPFGIIEHPTHDNRVAGRPIWGSGWVDCSEAGYGVALMGDAGCPVSAGRGQLRMALVGSSRDREAGQPFGSHRVTYSLLAHDGDYREGEVQERFLDLIFPIQVMGLPAQACPVTAPVSLFEFDRPGLLIDAIKRSEDERAIILRLHEAYGGRGRWVMRAGFDFKEVYASTLMERAQGKIDHTGAEIIMDIGPREIVTLRFLLG
jgi:alpha-mannosidase